MSSPYGIRQLANWILDYADGQDITLTNMSLNKLLYFAYEHILVTTGRSISGAKIEAWEHGPVFREVYRSFKEAGDGPITARAQSYNTMTDQLETAKAEVTKEDERLIEDAISPLIRLSASVLRELSHAVDGPWYRVWNHQGFINPGMQITDREILSSPTRSHSQ